MNSFLNHGQTRGGAWREGGARGELVGGNEKREGWQKRTGSGQGEKFALDRAKGWGAEGVRGDEKKRQKDRKAEKEEKGESEKSAFPTFIKSKNDCSLCNRYELSYRLYLAS